jgi:LCP family protein required for cell wall assembly
VVNEPPDDKSYSTFQVKRPRKRLWLRILLWTVAGLVVLALAVGGGSYLWFYHTVGGANARVDAATKAALASPPASTLVSPPTTGPSTPASGAATQSTKSTQTNADSPAIPESPGAMDILVLGSDTRGAGTGGRSDTLILVHVDPSQNYLSILSIPRDLRVSIPGHGLNKINAAYAYGGPALSIRTVKQLTGININHFVEVDFVAFQDLTNALGGVYVDVDRRYYNADPSYEPINISPGYQLLGGHDALEYVRFRHDQNADFGRMERQQRFLSLLKAQLTAMGPSLLPKLPGLVNALFTNATTDLSANDILKLAYWGVKLNGDRIRQVRITGSTPTIGGVSYVVADSGTIKQAVRNLLNPPATSGSQSLGSTSATSAAASGSTSSTVTVGNGQAATIPNAGIWTALASVVPFQLEGPGYLPEGYKYFDRMPKTAGTYDIKAGSGTKPALKMIYRYQDQDEYLGIMETTWLDAPMASGGDEVQYNGVKFTVVGTSTKVDHIWWKQDGVLYWVSNTLSYLLSENELLKMAESFIAIPKQ